MKRFCLMLLIICCVFALAGCSKKLDSASITRDDARVGGSLSFVFDKNERKIFVGGEGEVLQFSTADETLGLEEGNRIGLKITAPTELLDVSTAKLEMNGVNYSADDFLEMVGGQPQRFFNLYPTFTKDDAKAKFCVIWQEGTAKQCYEVFINEGTRFMDKDGNVE